MVMANHRRSHSPPTNCQRSSSSPPTASSLSFPPELIPEVAKRLTSHQDFFAICVTCSAYRARPLTASNLASQAPFLLLIPHDPTQPHTLFHLPLRWIHRFRLPSTSIPDVDYVVTKSHTLGYRLAINDNYSCRLPKRNLSIVQLLTGEQACLPNPRVAISRLLLFGDLVVAWSHTIDTNIQYYHLGAARWCLATISFPNELEDLIFVKGTLYALVQGTVLLLWSYQMTTTT